MDNPLMEHICNFCSDPCPVAYQDRICAKGQAFHSAILDYFVSLLPPEMEVCDDGLCQHQECRERTCYNSYRSDLLRKIESERR